MNHEELAEAKAKELDALDRWPRICDFKPNPAGVLPSEWITMVERRMPRYQPPCAHIEEVLALIQKNMVKFKLDFVEVRCGTCRIKSEVAL